MILKSMLPRAFNSFTVIRRGAMDGKTLFFRIVRREERGDIEGIVVNTHQPNHYAK